MALKKCKECGSQISSKAEICPHCGYKPKRTSTLTWLITIFIIFGVYLAFTGKPPPSSPAPLSNGTSAAVTKPAPTQTPEQIAQKKKEDEAIHLAVAGAKLLKKSMRNPDSFKLESALVIDKSGAVCYEYHGQNGFGGMDVGHAVIAGDGKQFLTNDMDGFVSLWNRECANKPGQEVATAIRWFAL